MLSDDRSVNLVQEMLGIIPGQTRSYVSAATGSISLGGTPLSPQQLPIHTANSITGITYGVPSKAIIGLMTQVAQTLTATAGSRTITIGSAASIPAGTAIYVRDNTITPTLYQSDYIYIGTIATAVNSTTQTLINGATTTVSPTGTGTAYYTLSPSNQQTGAYSYSFTFPTTTITNNNVSYTFQAGDDFEQETMTYGKNQGFSISGGSGGAIDMNTSYMAQAVQLGVPQDPTTATFINVGAGLANAIVSVDGTNTNFVASDVGRKLYTKGNGTDINSLVLIGTITAWTSAISVSVQLASALATPLNGIEFLIGGFSVTTIPTPIEDLIFARSRLYIDDVAPFPISAPTPVIYQFLAFSYGLQCSWTPKFTGEGQQGINPTWSFALFTNYNVSGDFTIEHDTIASGKFSASSVESLKYAWRNRVPKIVQIDTPGSTIVNWFTPTASNTSVIGSTNTITATQNSTTINASTYTWLPGDVGKDVFIDNTSVPNGTWIWVGRITAIAPGAVATNATIASPFTGATITSATDKGYFATVEPPPFPVAGYGPTKTYTGVSIRCPILILNVSPISDQDGNDIVTVSWQMLYDSSAGSAGDLRIINQISTLPVAG
jgi:hypothetical protein